MKLLTHSRLKVARSCLVRHELEYEQGIRPVEVAVALAVGTLAHAWLEARLRTIAAPLDPLHVSLDVPEIDPYERERLRVMLAGYSARWEDDAQRYEVLAVERQFDLELRNPATGRPSRKWRVGGKIDAIVRERESARVLVVEHKTSAADVSTGSLYWRQLRIDSQIAIYLDGAKALGYDAAGVLYDVLGKPSLRPLKATPTEDRRYTKTGQLYASQRSEDETPDQYGERCGAAICAEPDAYYQRAEIVRLETEVEAARVDLWEMAHVIDSGRAPRNPDACLSRGHACPFLPVCGGEASLSDPTRYRGGPIHPELQEKTS
jgi:hypothetical protein